MSLSKANIKINNIPEYIKQHYEGLKRNFSLRYHSRFPYNNIQDFEEIFHDALVLSIRNAQTKKSDGNINSWLTKIFDNCSVNYLRSEKRNPRLMSQYGNDVRIDPDFFSDNGNNPLNNILAAEFKDIVMRYIQECNSIHREVLEMFYYKRLKIEEIAEILDKPVGTIKRRLFNARRILGKRLCSLVAELK